MRRGRKGRSEIRAQEAERREEEGGGAEGDEGRGFFACYLLCSLSPGHKGHTYIGFTVNPRRRIKQHNGEMRSGAWRTKRGRPWEMILCIYGFPSNVTALQFEWAWQHPMESLAVRKAASSFKSLSGIANKIKLAYTMLLLPSWENLKVTVNFFSTKYMKYTSGCPRLPKQMRVSVCAMDELPCYVEGWILGSSADDDEDEDQAASDIDADDPTLSDLSAGIRGDINNFRRESSDDLFDWRAAEDFNHVVEDGHNAGRPSSDGLLSWGDRDDIRHPTNSDEWIQGSGNAASADGLLLSLKGNMIDLSTPPSCKIHSFSKSDRTCSDIVDLTDSPVIIQL